MFCPNCGQKISGTTGFCGQCEEKTSTEYPDGFTSEPQEKSPGIKKNIISFREALNTDNWTAVGWFWVSVGLLIVPVWFTIVDTWSSGIENVQNILVILMFVSFAPVIRYYRFRDKPVWKQWLKQWGACLGVAISFLLVIGALQGNFEKHTVNLPEEFMDAPIVARPGILDFGTEFTPRVLEKGLDGASMDDGSTIEIRGWSKKGGNRYVLDVEGNQRFQVEFIFDGNTAHLQPITFKEEKISSLAWGIVLQNAIGRSN